MFLKDTGKSGYFQLKKLYYNTHIKFMESKYNFSKLEKELSDFWVKKEIFKAKIDTDKEPFCIVFPPPNANASLHLGHAMYVFEDVMIRYHKISGKDVFWVAGADHAGIETQFVYEKFLKKQGKSRFDFDRETLYADIWKFVDENRGVMEQQLKRLGFGLDWSRQKFTLDKDVVGIVYDTFCKLFEKNLVYRANRLVQYCTSCGTSFSDLEVVDKEIDGNLYFIDYPFELGEGSISVATTRPETLFGDTAVMVNPGDKRYQKFIGKNVRVPLSDRLVPIIADSYVDKKFGTGAVKVTPAHDLNDNAVAKRHNLQEISVIDFSGKMINTGVVDLQYWSKAREMVISLLTEKGSLKKISPHKMTVGTCYRCGTILQPLPKEQWFISVAPLKKEAIKLIQEDKIQVHPKRFKKQMIQVLDNFIDWNISRQIVWGMRIPAYKCLKTDKWFVVKNRPEQCEVCGECQFTQDEDTFDTWFSSGQWPFATLQSLSNEKNNLFNHYYPTTVMETGYDIMRAWVSRMIMLGYFATGEVPFKHVFYHGMVRDKFGQKMSKSKGNVINPNDMIAIYGADALRASLIFGTKEGGDLVLSEEKIRAMRNFGNKIWNIGRFIHINKNKDDMVNIENDLKRSNEDPSETKKEVNKMLKDFELFEKQYQKHFSKFEFARAFDLSYEFMWHKFADIYIEKFKDRLQSQNNSFVLENLENIYFELLKCIHPFMPFVTEAVWQSFKGGDSSILISQEK
jgi:valyl-tRNA synthetase